MGECFSLDVTDCTVAITVNKAQLFVLSLSLIGYRLFELFFYCNY